MTPSLTFIVLACHMNVSVPDEKSPSCKVFKEEILETEGTNLTPWTCMMQSPIQIIKFQEQHPGWQARKWTCKYLLPSQDI
jgi:hypothetical protein